MFLRGRGTGRASSSRGDEVFVLTGPRIVLITGGARSGKSRFALRLADEISCPRRLFVATAVACDAEMKGRIRRHRRERNGLWRTLEEPVHLPERLSRSGLSAGDLLLFDCLPTFVTNHLLAHSTSSQIRRRVRWFFDWCRRRKLIAVCVTNEVGFGIVPDHPLGRRFRDLLGAINQEAASAADEVYLLVAGLPVRLK